MLLKLAMKILRRKLQDKDYRYAWQASIAVCFRDELYRQGYKLPDEYKISNEAAKNFLNLLCQDIEK